LGATEAIFSAVQAVIGAGDEAIAFDPAYDSYEPAVRLAGGRGVGRPLARPGFRYDWERTRAALTERTRLVLFNSPHNPACTTATGADLDALAQLIHARDIVVLSDEVYEHVVFDGGRHISVLTHPGLAPRSFAVFSFGKTLHATGVRVGYCVAPPALTRELRKVHQFNTFSIAHPLQHAIAAYLAERPEPLSARRRRSRFAWKKPASSRPQTGRSARYAAMACCNGWAMLKVLNWCTLRSSRVSAGGATQYPTRTPVACRVLPKENTAKLRGACPGCVSTELCRPPSNTTCSYTSSDSTTISRAWISCASASRSAPVAVVQAGLCGLLNSTRRVRSVTAARARSQS